MLTSEEIQEIEHELEILPDRTAASIESLRVVQRHRGWVSDESLADVAAFLEMSPSDLEGVATFYNLVFRHPVGRHVIFVCDSVSCWIMGGQSLAETLKATLGIGFGGTSPDGRFTLLPIQCLGTCDHAPAILIDEDLHRDLTPERLTSVLNTYE